MGDTFITSGLREKRSAAALKKAEDREKLFTGELAEMRKALQGKAGQNQ